MEHKKQSVERLEARLLPRLERPKPVYFNRLIPTKISSVNKISNGKAKPKKFLTSVQDGYEAEVYLK